MLLVKDWTTFLIAHWTTFLAPSVSVLAAIFSAYLTRKNYSLSQKTADRSIYVDGQKFLLEI